MKSLFAIVLIVLGGPVFAAGFSTDNNFEARKLEGHIRVRCERRISAYHTCSRWTLFPVEYAYFTAGGVAADSVELRSQRADGKTVTKKFRYSESKQRTEKRVNLWIDTVFQEPLLDTGSNTIFYELSYKGKKVQSDHFVATIKENRQPQYCPDMVIQSTVDSDCQFPGRACSIYFRRLNYNCM